MASRSPKPLPVILVDDEAEVLFSSALLLRANGIGPVITLEDGRNLIEMMENKEVGAIVLDLVMPHINGAELLPRIVERFPEVPVIVMTATYEVEMAVSCMKDGAFDYLVKPVEENRFISAISRGLEVRTLRKKVGALTDCLFSDRLEHEEAFANILTQSQGMKTLFRYTEAVAGSNEPVLVFGETGVGKESMVEALHTLSGRSGKLVALNVAGLDDTMFSDTLFGHRKGAFTGATENREGLIAQAAGGSLFLDEIGDLKQSSQVKLLRLLQERKYFPLGADGYLKTDARILCATNRDLKKMMNEGQFRPDLFFRLSAHQIRLPPLRDRKEDIPLLVNHFFQEAAQTMEKTIPPLPEELFQLLNVYDFPGNIRELRALVFDALAQHQTGSLSLKTFREAILEPTAQRSLPSQPEAPLCHFSQGRLPTLKEAEGLLVEEAIKRSKGNKSVAAALLGISRQALNYKLRKMEK
ncbi:MAG: sigma-54-dependent Fis family transcriptional regulator [Magnetococcales bacterium]|nr:sigma-54-dependent Fis family transcriptional regulator [Magnetococcales bacterium]